MVPVEITRSGTTYGYAVTNLSIGNRLVTSITLSSTQAILGVNETQTITATVKPDNAENKDLTWTITGSGSTISSSTTSSATVKGVTEFTKVTLTATAKDGSGKSASCTVSVPKNFAYTGNIQSFTLPAGKYKFEAWGAQGGNGSQYYGWNTAANYLWENWAGGSYVYCNLTTTSSKTIYVGVGGRGSGPTSASTTSASVSRRFQRWW